MSDYDRSKFIGGADQAHLIGIAPYGCYRRLILSKRDHIEEDLSDNLNILRGLYLESAIADFYSDQTKRKLHNMKRRFFKEGRAAVGLDRHIVGFDERGPGALEIKAPSAMVFRKYLREGLPLDYSLQTNWYAGWLGWKWGAFAVGNFEVDPGLLQFDWSFDPELFALQLAKAEEAWKLVEFGPLPEKLEANSKACGRCVFFEQCHPSEMPTPDTGEELVQISTPALALAIADRKAASEVIAEAEELKEAANAAIKLAIGTATAVDAPGARIYHRASVRNGTDAKKLKKEFPEAAAACATQTTVRTLRIFERNQ